MIECAQSVDVYRLRTAGLSMAFRHVGDRWQHSVSIQRQGEDQLLLISDEGTPADQVLPSPALQDLRLEKLTDTVYEFQLLGQAGKEFYSAAIRFDGAAQAIAFDLCARRRASDVPLCTASRYRLDVADHSVALEHAENGWLLLLQSHPALELVPMAIPGHGASQCRLLGEGRARRLAAGHFGETGSGAAKGAASVRWQFQIRLRHS